MDINVANDNITQEISNLSPKVYSKVLSERRIYVFMKRVVDIIGAVLGIILLAPITLGIFIAKIVCQDKGSIIYTQNRIGKNGKIFKVYKFRSMVEGADEILEE